MESAARAADWKSAIQQTRSLRYTGLNAVEAPPQQLTFTSHSPVEIAINSCRFEVEDFAKQIPKAFGVGDRLMHVIDFNQPYSRAAVFARQDGGEGTRWERLENA